MIGPRPSKPGASVRKGQGRKQLTIQPEQMGPLSKQRCASLRYEVLTDIEEIRRIASPWDDLLAQSRCNRAYGCSTWYLAAQELVPNLQPLVFVGYRDHVLAGVFPLWLEPGRRLARFGDSYSDHLDVIAADDDSELIEGLVDCALQGTGSYDRLVLGPVRHDSNFVSGAKALGLGREIDEFFLADNALSYAVLDLSCGYDEYMRTLSRDFRHNLHRAWKKAERDALIVRELTPAELEPDHFADAFLSLHLSRFGDRSDFKSSTPWIRKLFPLLFTEKRLRVFAILQNDSIVAIDLETVTRSGMYGCQGGFLPEIQKYAPGKLLIHRVIQQAFLEGMAEYDFGWWGQNYKADWKPARREVGEIRLATRPKTCRTHDAEYFGT